MFEPIPAHLSLRDRIVQDLLRKIESEQLRPGDRLLSERALAQEYQVSRTALRDALRTLAGLGVVAIRHGKGVYVQGNQGLALGQALWAPFVVRPDTVSSLFAVRKVLETEASGWAAEKATVADKEHLLCIIEQARAARQPDGRIDLDKAAEADQAFHTALFVAAGNPIAARLMLNLLDLLAEVRKQSLSIEGRAWLSIREHEKIATRIQHGTAKAARTAMLDHLNGVEAAIIAELTPSQGSSPTAPQPI